MAWWPAELRARFGAAAVSIRRVHRGGWPVCRATKGELESREAAAAVRFQRDQQGRRPTDVRAHTIRDLLVVRYTGIFTQTEAHLAASE